jgi:hypothetical protein
MNDPGIKVGLVEGVIYIIMMALGNPLGCCCSAILRAAIHSNIFESFVGPKTDGPTGSPSIAPKKKTLGGCGFFNFLIVAI